MKLLQHILPVAALLFAATACTEVETYPLSGEECGPEDAVQELDAADCVVGAAPGV